MNTKFYTQWLRLAAGLFLLLAALAPVSPAYADSCLVTTDADSGAGSLRAMIADSACGTITFGGDYTIVLSSQLIVVRSVIIDGVGHAVTVSGNQAARVFYFDSGVTINLNNLTVANGHVNTSGVGGGIYNRGMLHVTNSAFSGNSAGMGGGIYSDGDALTVTDSTFTGNSATGYGGGIYSNGDALTVTDSTFTSNSATYYGGGICHYVGTTNVANSTFLNNTASWYGGGIYIDSGTVTVAGSDFNGNYSEMGAGIHNSGTLNVTNGTFSTNRAQFGGGGISNNGTLSVMNSTFTSNNVMFGSGGGILIIDGAVVLTNSTFSDNSAMNGGGILNDDAGTLDVKNSTFSDNYAEGIFNAGTATLMNSTLSGNYAYGIDYNAASTTTTLTNTIVANNGFSNCYDFGYGGIITGSSNLANDGSCGASFVNSSSILLGPLSDNGGPTQTMALLPGSAAIDAGDDAACPATDQRGVTRPLGAHCDIGAYETEITASDTTPPTITLTTPAEGAVYLLGQTVNADYVCQDEAGGSGLASCVGDVPNGSPIDTGSIGSKTFTVNAVDQANNTASVTHTYHVIYNFTGFTSPVDNPSVMNSAKAGQTIPFKWRLTNANGNPVTDLTGVSVMAVSLSCPAAPTTDAIEEYGTSSSGLQNLGDGYYQWNWKSPSTYTNFCKTLKLDLGEGVGFEHLALFQFRK